jgi:plastocyanin
MNFSRTELAVLAASIAALAAAGCGSSKSSKAAAPASNSTAGQSAPAAPAGGEPVKLEADESGGLYFNKKTLTAKAGKVTLVMANPKTSGVAHGVAVEGNGVDKDGKVVPAGGTSTVSVTLKPGRYSFYCPVPSHEKAGMKGTLLVQ